MNMVKKIFAKIFRFELDAHSESFVMVIFGIRISCFRSFFRPFFRAFAQIDNVEFDLHSLSYIRLRDALKTQAQKPSTDAPFLFFHYNYFGQGFKYGELGINIGDYIQTIATRNAVRKRYENMDEVYFDRDNLSNYDGKNAIVVMQGWFSHVYSFFPNERLFPIFLGMHLSSSGVNFFLNFIKHNPYYFKNRVVGCRDLSTTQIMKKLNIKHYFSRCLTLTLPKREVTPKNGKVYIVDVPKQYHKYIPVHLRKHAHYVEQRAVDKDLSIHDYYCRGEHYMKVASDLLIEYKEKASLIITSALHCASPCTAMGIPVVLIDFDGNMDRFTTLNGIIPVYSKDDLKSGRINYSPSPPYIEQLKKAMLDNLEMSINAVKEGKTLPVSGQQELWDYISSFNVLKKQA